MKQTLRLLASLALCYAAALCGALFSGASRSDWYASLAKPTFMPPAWLFGPVWTLLYAMMAISLFLVWSKRSKWPLAKKVFGLFAAQLIVNAFWSPAFFGLRIPALGLILIVILWVLLSLTVYMFSRISRPAACLLVPYLAWITFAMVLNCAIVYLN